MIIPWTDPDADDVVFKKELPPDVEMFAPVIKKEESPKVKKEPQDGPVVKKEPQAQESAPSRSQSSTTFHVTDDIEEHPWVKKLLERTLVCYDMALYFKRHTACSRNVTAQVQGLENFLSLYPGLPKTPVGRNWLSWPGTPGP